MGDEAKTYYDKIKKITNTGMIKCCHLSNIALNIRYPNSSKGLNNLNTSEERRKKRIELLFKDVKPKIDDILTGGSAGDLNSSSQEQKS